ncbi:MAG: hypothetical protein Q8Q08_01795 [Candidatus Omnitrophota bacterium]|nr:hypothetical protein [Candidatus Omnitrophota bacterium]MDZ4241380.1 hypothetical protein [Candidatus Omnitrophota bacterium]
MRKFFLLRWGALAGVFAAGLFLRAGIAAAEAAETPGRKTEVVFIATQHFIGDMPEGYTPGHLRALLKKVSPDALLVEAPGNVADPWPWAPMDLWQITKPWAEANKVPVLPAGWHNPVYQAELQKMFEAFAQKGVWAEYQKMERDFQSAGASGSCEDMNSEKAQQLWRDYHLALHRLYGRDTPWEEWNWNILGNVLKLAEKNRGKRIAVVFGGAHIYFLSDQLKGKAWVTVIPASRYFPLTQEEIEAETWPEDYLKALRILNFGVGAVPQGSLDRLEQTLRQVGKYRELEEDFLLFEGKFLMHSGQPGKALANFEKLAALDGRVISVFDRQTPLNQAGLFNAALAKAQMKRYGAARKDLKELLKRWDTIPEIKAAAKQVLMTLPAGK